MKKQNLDDFNFYDYLRNHYTSHKNLPFFLANQDTYKAVAVKFPFRNFFYGIGMTYTGYSGEVQIGSTTYPVQKGSLITIGPGTVSKWSTDYTSEHDTIFFTEELFNDVLKASGLRRLPFFKPTGRHVIALDEKKQARMKVLFDTLKEFQHDYTIVPGLIYSILQLAIQYHSYELITSDPFSNSSRPEKITQAFITRLTQHFLQERTVQFYAEQLNITPKYLSEVLLKTTGKTAKEHIVDLLLVEAKSLLKQTDMSVGEIATWLGYADPSYFSKLFKEQAGMTPLAYKQE